MWWFAQGWCFLPVFLVVWSSSTFIVSYVVALFRRDVDVLFPYISDTGANPPESCIFGMMTFVSACAGMATIYSRFKFVEKLCEETRAVNPRLNKTAMALGMLSCLGMCVVATFQETAVTTVHDIGALLFFLTGVLYILLQTAISYHAFPYGSSLAVCRARLAVAVLASLAIFPSILFYGCQESSILLSMLRHNAVLELKMANSKFRLACSAVQAGGQPKSQAVICAFFVKQKDLHRDAGSKDYPFHVASAVCEWIVAFSFVCFFLTYIDDFKLFTLRVKTEML